MSFNIYIYINFQCQRNNYNNALLLENIKQKWFRKYKITYEIKNFMSWNNMVTNENKKYNKYIRGFITRRK